MFVCVLGERRDFNIYVEELRTNKFTENRVFHVFRVKGTLGASVREDTSTIHHTTTQIIEDFVSGTSSLGPFLMGRFLFS